MPSRCPEDHGTWVLDSSPTAQGNEGREIRTSKLSDLDSDALPFGHTPCCLQYVIVNRFGRVDPEEWTPKKTLRNKCPENSFCKKKRVPFVTTRGFLYNAMGVLAMSETKTK